jgi:hypothetical protein
MRRRQEGVPLLSPHIHTEKEQGVGFDLKLAKMVCELGRAPPCQHQPHGRDSDPLETNEPFEPPHELRLPHGKAGHQRIELPCDHKNARLQHRR